MHANRDSIMKPAAAVRRYAGWPNGQCQIPADMKLHGTDSAAAGVRFMFRS
jgi:hypothetical protein